MTTYAEAAASTAEPPTFVEGGSLSWSGTGDWYETHERSERQRADLLNTTNPGIDGYTYRTHALENYTSEGSPRDVLEILPVPVEDLFCTILYLPQLTLAATGTPSKVRYAGVKGIGEEWLILDTLISLQGKTSEQTALWERRKAEIERELLAVATDRDASQPAQIQRVWSPRGRLSHPVLERDRWRARRR